MPQRIRIALMVYSFHIEGGGGGLTRAAIDIAERLDPEKFDISVYALGNSGTQAEETWIQQLRDQNIHASAATLWDEEKPYQSFLRSYRSLDKILHHHPVDILHSHSEFTDIAAAFLKLQKKVPVILRTTHYGYAIEWRDKPIRRAITTNFLYPMLFDLEVGVNPSMRDRLNQRLFARLFQKESLFINEAVQLERFQDVSIDIHEKKRSLGIPADHFVIGCVGRLAEQKGYPYLLEAAAMVIQAEPRTTFLIIGDGPLAESLKQFAVNLNIQNQVIFTGSRSDVEELFACLDLYAMASLWEGMPISVLESMACGVPVVTTSVPGSRDLIQHGFNGWLVPPMDSQSLGGAILKLQTSPELREMLIQNARDTVQGYSADNVAKRYESIYFQLMKDR